MQCKQRLVGGDHVLAVVDRFQHQLFGNAITADQFDDDVNVRIAHHAESIIGHRCTTRHHLIRQCGVLVGNVGNGDRTPGAT